MFVHRVRLLCTVGVVIAAADSPCRLHVDELRSIYDALSPTCAGRLPPRWQSSESERRWHHLTRMCDFEYGWRHVRTLQADLEHHLIHECREEVLGGGGL